MGISVKYPASQQWLLSVVARGCLLVRTDTGPLGFWQSIRTGMNDGNQARSKDRMGQAWGMNSVTGSGTRE